MDRSLGVYLVELRQQRGLSPTAIARHSQVSRSSLYNWESGRSMPRLQELESVLKVLGASPEQTRNALLRLDVPRAQKRLQEIEPSSDFLPTGGDLLRAMRLRRGWTQAQAATIFKVSQPTVARWERSESWPGPELLQRICHSLRAQSAETAALSRGPFALSRRDPGETEIVTPERLEAALSAIQKRQSSLEGYGIGDLLYLDLEAQAVPLLQRSESGRILLARIFLSHAAYVGYRCQPMEAGRIGEQALKLLPARGEQWNAMRLSAEMYWAVWKFPIREHARVLGPWLDRRLDYKSLSWVTAQIGSSLNAQGEKDLAVAMAERAVDLTIQNGGDAEAVQNRRNGYAEMLLGVGRASEAVELLSVLDGGTPPTRVRTKIALTKAHLKAGSFSRAHDWLLQASTDNDKLDINYYQPQIDELAAQL